MQDAPSKTAAWVALARTLGDKLPRAARLAHDPYGVRFSRSPLATFVARAPGVFTVPAWSFVLYMQVRTRAIDDVLRSFVAGGAAGRQLLLLGAGYDCRAVRFAAELAGARVFEVDHPATQARKREVLAEAGAPSAEVTYVPWNFEARPTSELPGALAELGFDAARPTLTVWEGVTMYLSEGAIAASVAAVRALSGPGSRFVVSYIDRGELDRRQGGAGPRLERRLVHAAVARVGEPFVFGWHPHELPAWFDAHGFDVEWDHSTDAIAETLLPRPWARAVRAPNQRIALLARRAG